MSEHDLVGAKAAPANLEGQEKKASASWTHMAILAVMAGIFIAFGSIAYLIAQSVPSGVSGPTNLLSGLAFSVGLVLVMVAGAQLFTGNTMMLVPLTEGDLSPSRVAAAWTCVWLGNLAGSLLIVALLVISGGLGDMDGAFRDAAVKVAEGKLGKGAFQLIAAGILANILVCLAVWMSAAAIDVTSKVLAIVGPVTVFVAAGFEHSIANMSLIPIGIAAGVPMDLGAVTYNLVLVTFGNILGGAIVAFGLSYGHGAVDD
ncbi:formate/nitrite transporter family protein [Palleronia sp. LCG004]|uniref:formate/nitrite transporter family protein n=1 Tax=Palleronia sp. LCG004 TaxID=3079304 RepID=UPI0029425466|nr:formate/nitrite transporter family protein [Palleronia sp. LCG004]WOI57967.1 formate/nitrite transporter family protein [Palleronia sp. LCG004]